MANALDSNTIATEYSQWRLTMKLLFQMRKATKDSKPSHHKNNTFRLSQIFGRWLITIQHFDWTQLDDKCPLFPRQPLIDDASKSELVRLLQEMYPTMTTDAAIEIADEQLNMIEQFLTSNSVDSMPDAPPVTYRQGGQISVGKYETPCCSRVQFLVENYGLVKTARAFLRYQPLSNFRGGESGLSVTAMNALYDIGGVRYEGFASPINCRLLGRPDVKFCSLFQDTDSAFGSLGNFFRINLADHPGGWVLNPPSVEPVMEAAAQKVVQLLEETERGSFWFFITFPRWEDSRAWQMLDQCEWKVASFHFDKNRLSFQDSFQHQEFGLQIEASIFVVGDVPETVDLLRLRDHLQV